MPLSDKSIDTLIDLLRQRLGIIADHSLRTINPAEHLLALKTISEAIEEENVRLHAELPPRLRHFFDQSSYHKALAFLEELHASK